MDFVKMRVKLKESQRSELNRCERKYAFEKRRPILDKIENLNLPLPACKIQITCYFSDDILIFKKRNQILKKPKSKFQN